MTSTISTKLFKTLQRGKEQLGAEALRRVAHFVESQRTDEGAFKDKSGKADLYYTSFGWALSYLLGLKIDRRKMDSYLSQQAPERMDLVHYAAYMRCKLLRRLVKRGKIGMLLPPLFLAEAIKPLDKFQVLPNGDRQSPYTQLLWLSLLEDAGRRVKDKQAVTASLAGYRLSGGGYANTKGGQAATTNATVAALAVKGQLSGYRESEEVLHLRNMQGASGDFRAAADSPVPDLLSTATALFVLSCYKVKPKYAAHDFVEAHWLNSGGFSATLLEDKSDVEYTFYGLLALGGM